MYRKRYDGLFKMKKRQINIKTVQYLEDMAADIQRMRRNRFRRTRQFIQDVIRHQECVQESVNRM